MVTAAQFGMNIIKAWLQTGKVLEGALPPAAHWDITSVAQAFPPSAPSSCPQNLPSEALRVITRPREIMKMSTRQNRT